MRTSEYWLNKIGIGLLLFGVAFLFKYSIDQGWLTPTLRVGFGVILGVGLIVTGQRLSASRRDFSQVLIGGGIATLYITGFAAYQLLDLISHPVAFAFMAFVTLFAFILSLRQNGVALSLIGAIGGLGTPFLLYTDTGSLPGLVVYTCLLLLGTSAIYFYRGWRSLLWASVLGGWLVILVGIFQIHPINSLDAMSDLWALQFGVIFCWLAFWMMPVVREYVWDQFPHSQYGRIVRHRHLHMLSVSTPLIALWMSMPIWTLSNPTWGWITLGGALVYGFAAWGLSQKDVIQHLSYTHSLVGVMLLTYSFFLLLDGDLLLVVLTAEAATLLFIARRLSDVRVAIIAHFLFGIAGLWLAVRLSVEQAQGTSILNMQAMTDLLVIGIASASAILSRLSEEKKIYLFILHIALLGWFLRELASLPNGQGYVTIAWGIYAIILLILGLRINYGGLQTVAMATLLLIVGKLFLVDLAELETIWRILLFLGFGGLFLLLSYYFRALWKSSSV